VWLIVVVLAPIADLRHLAFELVRRRKLDDFSEGRELPLLLGDLRIQRLEIGLADLKGQPTCALA
jgi:hypothetical protein